MYAADATAGFGLPDEFWARFVDVNWEREPTVLKQPFPEPLLGDRDILTIVQELAERYRNRGSGHRDPSSVDPIRLNVAHSRRLTDVGPLLPAPEDKSLGAYIERVGAALQGQPFELIANDVQACDIDLLARLQAFLGGLYRRVGLPAVRAEAVLFLRDHEMTSFGAHTDDASVFMFVLHGHKRLLTWPPDRFADRPDAQMTASYEDIRECAAVLEAEPGDVVYWPSSSWHVAESKRGLSVSISVATRMGQRPMTEVGRYLARLVSAAAANESVAMYEGDRDHGEMGVNLPTPIAAALATTAGVIESGALAQELAMWWLNRCTSGGFAAVPPPGVVRYIADDDLVSTVPGNPVRWMIRPDGRLACSANGNSVVMPLTSPAIALLERLGEGETWRLGDLLEDCGAAGAGRLRETLRLLAAELAARRGLLVNTGNPVLHRSIELFPGRVRESGGWLMSGSEFERKQANGAKVWALIGRAWADEEFKQSLIANPEAVLALNGVELPEGTTVKVLEETPEINYLVIPAKPSDFEVVDYNDEGNAQSCLSFAL